MKKFAKRALTLSLAMIMTLTLVACGSGSKPSSAPAGNDAPTGEEWPKMTLTFSGFGNGNDYNAKLPEAFMAYVTETTGGNIKFTTYYNQTLYGNAEMMPAVTAGDLDMACTVWFYTPSLAPMHQLCLAVPFTTPTAKQAIEVQREFAAKYADFASEEEKNNIVSLAYGSTQDYNVYAKTPINNLSGLNSQKLSFGGNFYAPMLSAAGVVQVAGGIADFYQSIKTNVSNGTFLDQGTAASGSLYEILDYGLEVNMGARSTFALMMNADKYNALPDNVKELFTEASAYAEKAFVEWYETEGGPADAEKFSHVKWAKLTGDEKKAWAEEIQFGGGVDPIELWIKMTDEAGYNGKAAVKEYLAFLQEKGVELMIDPAKYN